MDMRTAFPTQIIATRYTHDVITAIRFLQSTTTMGTRLGPGVQGSLRGGELPRLVRALEGCAGHAGVEEAVDTAKGRMARLAVYIIKIIILIVVVLVLVADVVVVKVGSGQLLTGGTFQETGIVFQLH
jgi:hypothetical protein